MPCAARWIAELSPPAPDRAQSTGHGAAAGHAAGRPSAPANTGPAWWWRPREDQASVGNLADSSAIQAKLDIEVRSVVGLFYRPAALQDRRRARPAPRQVVGRLAGGPSAAHPAGRRGVRRLAQSRAARHCRHGAVPSAIAARGVLQPRAAIRAAGRRPAAGIVPALGRGGEQPPRPRARRAAPDRAGAQAWR